MKSVSLLITGSELLDGRVQDTNTRYLAEELTIRGITFKRVLVVDDDLEELVIALKFLSEVSDLLIISGGLGPTADDLTREAVSKWSGLELIEHPLARKHLEDFYSKRGRVVDQSNLRQAFVPATSELVHNPVGTAPGFLTTGPNDVKVLALPGVPKELIAMCRESVLPIIENSFSEIPGYRSTGFKTYGLPESEVGVRVVKAGLPDSIKVSYRAAFPDVHVKLISRASDAELAEAKKKAIAEVGVEFVFTEDLDKNYPEVIVELLREKKLTLSTAESCTGGMLGELITSVSGASEIFIGSVVSYANQVKIQQLGVDAQSLNEHGAVSEEIAVKMALGVKKKLQSDIGISITGIAGPLGGSPEKPVGTFFIGYADDAIQHARKYFFSGDRERIRRYASFAALDEIRRNSR